MRTSTSSTFLFFIFRSFFKPNLNFFLLKKKITSFLLIVILTIASNTAFAQLAVPFSPRLPGGNIKVKGDVILIGNTIITGKGLSLPYNGGGNNNDYEGEYINVASGGDPSIFSSSTADLFLDNSCKSIVYAGLYWASVYPNEVGTNGGQSFTGTPRIEDWNQVKFKLPTGGFIDLVADNNADPVGEEDDIIFDGYDPVNINNSFKDSPIICYKNVTNLLQGLSEADGTYTVANLRATTGRRSGGCAAGWTLVVIYESPQLPSKFISIFDGYAGVQGSTTLDIPVTGFQTLPAPLPVVAKIGVAALEGDLGISGDTFRFKASTSGSYTRISDALNYNNNFFNSKITNEGAYMNNRNPNSTNVLGFDIANVIIPNPNNSVLPNDATAGDLRLTTSGDGYGAFVTSFAVDIIEPNIVLTKIVEDEFGNDIGGEVVDLAQQLNYVIGFQNIGNDDATDFTIRDILPTNIDFNYPSDIEPLPTGVTIESYDATTREIIFRVDDSLIEEFGPVTEIRFSVRVVSFCNLLNDACADSVDNQAYATYRSKLNPSFIISDDPSYDANNGCLLSPQATNFLADISDCTYSEEVILCGGSTDLTAPDGYDSYQWSTSSSGTPVIGTTKTITITNTGTYYVRNTALAPCQSSNKEFEVITFGANVENPVIPYADQVVTCPNDGKKLPNIFLCGGAGGKFIQTNLSDTTSLIWERLDETSCSAVLDSDCANEDKSCTWNQVATGSDYMADTAGQFRLTVNYPGGCFNQFYFNVYSNILTPTVTKRDIICTTQGEIVVGGVPNGYEYSIDGTNYQSSNTFVITAPDLYTVYIRQIGVSPNPCIFTVTDVQIRERNFTVSTIINQPLCNGDLGNVVIAVNDVRPQYFYSISQGGTVVNSVGPVVDRDYTFSNLNPGTYTIDISTEDGCVFTDTVQIIDPPLLEATSALTTPLTCEDGEITVSPVGGTPPYFYFLNGSTDFETIPTIVVTASGVFDITVVDSNNCSTQTSITVDQIPQPVFNITKTDVLCYNYNSGEIQFNVTNANGYTVEYSIDNGVTYVSNSTFSNLYSGTYPAIIKYSLNGTECFSSPQDVIINQPSTAITASAGVSELAGCGASGEGKVRITNPQGGVAPYEYSFDNQGTWTNTNEAYLAPGTYTLYIRDVNGCVFPMSDITIDPEPVAPTINISDPDFNCDGTANSTVTITNSSSNSFAYTYLLDGVENPNTADPKTFLNVPDGAHTVSVTYQLQTVPTFSNLLSETFGSGLPTTTPGIASAYCFNDQRVNAPYTCGTRSVEDNQYSVASFFWRSDDPSANNTGAWYHFSDHTTNGADPDGRFLLVNIGSAAGPYGVLYSKPIVDIIPNQEIRVDLYLANLVRAALSGAADPDFRIQLVDGLGNVVAEEFTGLIPKNEQWNLRQLTLNPGNNTELTFVIRSGSVQYGGNDALIDDISIYQLPTTCITQKDFPIVIGSGNAFMAGNVSATDVSCVGAGDGTITISAQNFDPAKGFQYSLDGVTWITQMTSPYTITGLSDGNYNVQLRYEDAVDTCEFNFNQNIGSPTAVVVSVSSTPITCLDGSTVTATATGGTAAYSYELLDTSLNLISNFPSNGVLTSVGAGDYIIRATDANGCTNTTSLNLENPIPPTATIINADYCYDGTNGASLEVSASGGQSPYEYNINGGAFQTNPVFGNLPSGTYTIIVRDAYGCTFTLPTETIEPQISISVALTKELDCTASPNAVITGTISDGYSPYTYAVSIDGSAYTNLGSIGTSFTYNAIAAGTYQFQVTDNNSCPRVSNVITVNPITNPVATATTTDANCNGASDGSVQLIGSGGSGGYTYSDDNVSFTATSLFTGLPAGSYTFYIKDSKNCTSSVVATISEPTVLVATASATAFSCSATNTKQSAVITIAIPTTGTSPYQYSFDGGINFSASNTLTVNDNGLDQTFSYVIRDANGCLTSAQNITLNRLDPPTDLAFTSTAITCIATTSTVDLTATNGVGTLQYETISPSPIIVAKQTSNSFSGLTEGTYVFRVTDANGCYYTESYTINPVTPITITGSKLSDVLCFGDNTGAINYTVSGFSGTYTSALTSGSGTLAQTGSTVGLTGLIAGSYTVEVTDDITGCTADATLVITEPAAGLTFTATSTNVYCTEGNSQITVTPSGGTSSYTYAAVVSGAAAPGTYASSNVITVDTNSASDLDWDVYVQDANGCITMNTITITADPLPTVTTPALASNQCSANSGFTFTATGASGVTPYQYSINGGASYQASPTFTVNTPGSYTVTIRDANGCTATSATPTVVYEPLTSIAAVTKELDCSASPDAVITVTISGGSTPFTYTVQKGAGAPSAPSASITGPTFTYSVSLADVDNYTFEITDANGCTSTSTITVNPITNPVATATTTDANCNGASDGSVQLIGSGGSGGYTYSDDNVSFTATSLFTGLPAGSYTFYIKDSKNCTSSVVATISEPTVLVATASATAFSCSATNTKQSAVITIAIPTTGTSPYQYSFDGGINFSASNTLTVNDNGLDQTFSYVIRDANGCLTSAQNITLNRLDPPTDLAFTSTAITCIATTSTVDLTATNGVGTLQYETISPSPIIVAKQTSNSFSGLTEGTYVFRVTDANGCYYTESYTINPVTPITITGSKLSDVLCFGDNTGAINYTVSGFSGTYTSALTSGSGTLAQTGSTVGLTGLIAGSYTVEVTDDITGCTADATLVITEPAAGLTFTATSTNVYCTEGNSQITVTPSGGTSSYTYAAVVSGAAAPGTYASSNVITVDTNSASDLDWDVYVQDANGCITMNTITITADPLPTVTTPALASNQCSANSGFTFTATGASGVTPYQYSINGGASYQASPTFTVNTPGSYTVTIRDANGCTATSATPTVVYEPITTSALLTKDITCSPAPTDASIDISVSGGNAPYSYEVSTDGGATYTSTPGSPYTTAIAGNYQFRITDANGCTQETNTITVTTPVNPVITSLTETQSILCSGEDTAAIQVNFDNTVGTASFVINVNNDTTGYDYGTQTSGLAAGDYTITLTDANGCFDTDTITINEPAPIILDFDVDPITCGAGGVSLGQIIINSVVGGTPNYTYHVTGVNGYNKEVFNQTGATQVFEVVNFGLYEIIITDTNGCTVIEQNILVASPPDDLDIDIATTVDCATGGEAEVSIGASSSITGSGPFYFAIYTGPGMVYDGTPIWQLGAGSPVSTTFTGLIPDVTYTFIVYDDDTKCYYYETATTAIKTNSTLSITGVTPKNITCIGSADGNVSFDITSTYGADTDVTYEVFDSQSLAPITPTAVTGSGTVPSNGTLSVTNLGPLDFGNYIVVIEETTGPNAGCGVATIPFNITQSAIDLTISASSTRNENCNELGVISAIAQNGTAPYEYQFLLDTATAPIATDLGWITSNTFEGAEDDYTVYVKDAYGCIKSIDVSIIKDPLPTINPVAQQCFDGTPINITLVEGTGIAIAPLTYSIGGAYQSSDTFTISAAGTYDLFIKDGNGCIATTTYVVESPLLLDANMSQDLTCAVDASIDLTASGGTGSYTSYEVSSDGGATYTNVGSAIFTTTTDGTYQFRVTDSQGCQSESSEIIVTPRTTPTLTEVHTDVTCNGGSDGSIVVTAGSGIAPYQYSIDGGTTFQASNVFNGLDFAGSPYSVLVRDSKSCDSAPTSVTINEPSLVGGSGALTQGLTCGAGNATQPALVTITGSGGTAPYTYSFDGGLNYTGTNTYSTYTAGTVTAYVKDANGCTIVTPIDVVVPALDIPTDLDFTATAVTCLALTSDVTLTATNGVGPLSYEIISPASATGNTTGASSGTFTGLSPDTYTFRVTDANGCIYTESYTVTPVTNIAVSGLLVSDVSCNGGSNGAVDFTVSNFAGTYSYTINGTPTGSGQTATTISLTGLPIGNQVIIVTDETTGCDDTVTILVSEPTVLTLTETTNINANCNFGAQITVEANGGAPNYRYAFVENGVAPILADYTSSASAVLDPATNTNWDVWVIDSNGCTEQIDVVIDTDPLPTINPVAQQCFDGTPINITLVEGTGIAIAPLTYSIGGAYQSSDTFTISAAGTYDLFIKDGNGCIATTTYVVESPLLLDANMSQDLTCAVDASIDLTASGGTGSYTSYEVSSDGGATYTNVGSAIFTTTTDGTYQFRVTDSQGCQSESSEIIVTPRTTPTLTEVHTDVTCNGGSDGSIVVTAGSGIAPYQYSIDGGTTFQASNVFNGLDFAGSPYSVLVRDSKSCDSAPTSVTINEPSLVGGSGALTQGLTCGAGNATQPALVTITGSGGTAPYTYSFDGGLNYTGTNTYSTYTAGTVTAYVKDANGCTIVTPIDVVVPALDIPTDLDFTATAVTCLALTSDVTLTATNGVGPLSYEIISPASATGNTTGASSGTFTGLSPDTYTFRVTDANGCIYTESYTVTPVTNIAVSGLLVSDVSCNGGSNGAVDFTVSNFAGTYSYTINGTPTGSGQTATTISLTGLPIGNQVIIVTDETTGCDDTVTILVSEPTVLTLTETTNINANCNFGAQITVEANGGAPNYRYAFVENGVAPILADYTSSASAVLDPATNTNWDVWVIDSNGCTEQIDVVIDTDPLPTVTVPALASNQCNLTGNPYTFTVTSTTGIAPFTYSIGSGFQSSSTFTVSTPGNYFVTVRDANGCEAISTTSVDVYQTLDLSPAITVLPSCADDDGEITMTGSGGSGNYTYSISPTAGSITITGNVISGVPAGTYTVTITDTTTLCTRDINVAVDAPTLVTFTTTPTDVSCNGGNDGNIVVNLPASNDNPIYTYSLDGGITTQTSNIFSGLIAGTYNITVTSGRNCILTQPETVNEPNIIVVPTPVVVEYACTANTNSTTYATITVSGVTGGSSNYTIYEFVKGGTIVQANANNVYTEADLSGGSYTINVYDDNGCFGSTTTSIQPFIELDTLDITVDNAITCTNDEDITVSVTSIGGTPTNLQYTVEDVDGASTGTVYSQTNPTGIFTSLPIANYLITVVNLDTGCSLQTTHYVNDPNTFDLTIDNVVDVTCFSDSDGRVDVTFIDRVPTPIDESGAFSYNISDVLGNPVTSGTVANAGPTTISGLVAGTYTITANLTNTPFCTISKNFTITAPTAALAITETHTEITCVTGNNDGSISASASGGWPGDYEYQLELTAGPVISPYSDVYDFTALTAGNYTISVRDSQGCVASTNVVLVIPIPIDAQAIATPALVSCFGDTNATITVNNVTGGQGFNYTFTLNMISPTPTSSGPQNSNVFSGLGAGTYNVTVRDGYNCEFVTTDIVINQPTEIQPTLVKTTSQTCLTNSELTLSATGGTGTYEYSDTMSFTTVLGTFASDVTFSVAPGTYQYYVRDANSCGPTASNEITIDPLPTLVIDIDPTNAIINCTGDTSGVIVAEAIGGLGDYTYILQDASGTDIFPAPTQNSPGVFTELPAGIYQVRVTSGIDCEEVSAQVEITEPEFALQTSYSVTDVACSGGNDGIMEIVATGGTGIIKYAISPQLNQFFDTPIFEDLVAGDYQAIAQDELGCYVLIDFTVAEPTPIMLSIVPNSIIPEACEGELDGEFSVDISGGSMPYSLSLDSINGTYNIGGLTQTQFDFTGLSGGDHTVYVVDSQGCESEWNITFPESVRIKAELDIDYCTDNSDASTNMLTITVDNTLVNLTDLDYSIDGGAYQLDNRFIDIVPGNHFVTVRHTNTCEVSFTFEIEQYDPLELTLADGNINEIVASATGGSGIYQYEVQYELDSSSDSYDNTNTFLIYKSGNYTVTVTDSNGCTTVASRFFEYIDVCITNYFTPNNDGNQDEWGPGCTSQYQNLTVDVFDRYGRKVSTLRVGQKWDGKYKGIELPSGDYWYIVKLNDERDDREFVGHFTLYR